MDIMDKVMASLSVSFLPQKPKSSLKFNTYPTLRDHPLHTAEIWLEGKRHDDGAEQLWRIHNKLYDFTEFITNHPGGEDWLKLTKGTDITEAFEVHHISTYPESLLSNYFIRAAKTPRNSPFSFHKNGFYKTLQSNVREALKDVPETPATTSKIYADALFITYLIFASLCAYLGSYTLAILAGLTLSMLCIASHNFFHQKDNFRMRYFDLTMQSSRSWRVTHALSHHVYTNTVYDFEMSFAEPWFQYLPVQKHLFWRYISWIYAPIIYLFVFYATYIRMLLQLCRDKGKSFEKSSFLPFTILCIMLMLSNDSSGKVILLFTTIIMTASVHFGIVGLNAAHHHPNIFHDGDAPRSREDLDWGLHEMVAVMDREDINWSHFLVLTNFGDHCLHHLFPTVDHGRLRYLYPVFQKTCEQFGVKHGITTQMELILGQYQQLAKVTPNTVAPISKRM